MVETFRGKVRTLDYKTLRYPGHLRRIKLLGDLGFWSDKPVVAGEVEVQPRAVLGALLERQGWVKEDLIALAAWGIGVKNSRRLRIDARMLDFYDETTGLSAMARTTGFPAAILARMLMDGRIADRGGLRQEAAVPQTEFLKELEKRGVRITFSVRRLEQ